MERHHLSSMEVANFLEAHPKVIKVNHPLLKSSPYQHLALSQNNGRHSGMVAFCVKGKGCTQFLKPLSQKVNFQIDFVFLQEVVRRPWHFWAKPKLSKGLPASEAPTALHATLAASLTTPNWYLRLKLRLLALQTT